MAQRLQTAIIALKNVKVVAAWRAWCEAVGIKKERIQLLKQAINMLTNRRLLLALQNWKVRRGYYRRIWWPLP